MHGVCVNLWRILSVITWSRCIQWKVYQCRAHHLNSKSTLKVHCFDIIHLRHQMRKPFKCIASASTWIWTQQLWNCEFNALYNTLLRYTYRYLLHIGYAFMKWQSGASQRRNNNNTWKFPQHCRIDGTYLYNCLLQK